MDRRILKRSLDARHTVKALLDRLPEQTIEDLHRRGNQLARGDGYPMRSGGGAGGGPSILVPNEEGDDERVAVTGTEMAALSDDQRDRVGRYLAEMWALLDFLADTADEVDKRRRLVIDELAELRAMPAGAGHCLVCTRWCPGTNVDRIKGGYCPKDFMAWNRAGRPERAQFERERRAELMAGPRASGL